MYKIPMKFKDGDKGNKMRNEFAGKSTIQLILEGHRTATSRDMSKKYNQYNLKVGDIVEFYSDKQKVSVIITKEPYPISDISKKEWSVLEGWDESVYDKLNKHYHQYQFTLI
jgi:ASC-1-like (ASCH) protein